MTAKSNAENGMEDGEWASSYELQVGTTHYHELSHTSVWVTLMEHEWQIRYERLPEDDDQDRWSQTITTQLPVGDQKIHRFVRADRSQSIRYLPVMSERAMVIRPYHPLTLPADSECTIYVGTLVWMRILVGEQQRQLMELPLADPTMTWVGRNTMEGELCYSAATFARLDLDLVPKRPWRAITPVRIRNRQSEPLLLERFSLPTPLLSLHRNSLGHLWTPRVTVTCESGMNSARLKVDQALIAAAGDCTRISEAREQPSRGGLIRAYDRMFG